VSSTVPAVAETVEPAPVPAPEPAPAGEVSAFLSQADNGLADGAGTDPLLPAGSPLEWALAAVARRDPVAAASVAAPAAQVAVGEVQTNNGVSADPTVEFVDGVIQGVLNATSERGLPVEVRIPVVAPFVGRVIGRSLPYLIGSNGGKLDLGTVPISPTDPFVTDPQSFNVLPYATWLDAGGSKGTEEFAVRLTEVTPFTEFITSIPLVGLLADPIIGLLQRTPFVSSLLAPLIGGSLLATIEVDVDALAPGETPVAFSYDVVSFDGTPISTNFFPASGIAAGETAPTVLDGPGLGSPGETDPYYPLGTFGTVPGIPLVRDAGYNLITWDPRGEFNSGGVLQLDNPFFEGRDASAIVSWAANNPLVEKEPGAPDDPKVGMIGGSYGGGIQMVTAATDPRIDAIVPNGNWYSLMDALYPNEVFKTAWALLLTLDLLETDARINTQIYEGVLTGSLFGFLSQASQAVLTSSGPTSLLNQLQAPTLLFQGTVDALFPLDQSVLNAETITANPFDTPVKLGWFCGGHGACTTGASPTQRAQIFADTFAWLDTYVAGVGQAADAVPVFQWWDQAGNRFTSDLLPFQDGFNKVAPYTATSDGGTLGIFPIIGGSGPDGSVSGFPVSLIFPTEAGNSINVDLTPGTGEQIVGAPQLSFTYRGLGTSSAVYAQFVDDATGQIVGNNVTAVPVILDGRERTASVPLNDIAYTVGTGDSLTLQITDWSSIFFNAGIGVVDISDVQVDLPLRAIPASAIA
jgi:ABC-2 type transport system ATP-binding protein